MFCLHLHLNIDIKLFHVLFQCFHFRGQVVVKGKGEGILDCFG